MKGTIMRNITAWSIFALAVNCWAIGASAQPAASNMAAPKAEGALNTWSFKGNYAPAIGAGSTKPEMLSNDIKTKPGSGFIADSTAHALPESVRVSAKYPTVEVAFKTADLQQAKIPGQVSSSLSGKANTLNVKTELNRR
jgi:hypothetical protein